MRNTIFIFLTALLFTSCSKNEITYDSIAKCQWTINELTINGESYNVDTDTEEVPLLIFVDSTHVAGYAGCNRYMGKYSLNNDTIQKSIIGTTKVLCSEEEMEKESKYIDALSGNLKADISSDGTELTLTNSNNNSKISFKKGENLEASMVNKY